MDQERFDQLTRTLATGKSRRSVLKGLTGTAVGGLLAAVGMGEAVAKPAGKPSKCYGENSSCTNGKQCCSGTCTNRTCAPVTPVVTCMGGPCDPFLPFLCGEGCTCIDFGSGGQCVVAGSQI
jgi:hypothetical protein